MWQKINYQYRKPIIINKNGDVITITIGAEEERNITFFEKFHKPVVASKSWFEKFHKPTVTMTTFHKFHKPVVASITPFEKFHKPTAGSLHLTTLQMIGVA